MNHYEPAVLNHHGNLYIGRMAQPAHPRARVWHRRLVLGQFLRTQGLEALPERCTTEKVLKGLVDVVLDNGTYNGFEWLITVAYNSG